MISDVINNHNKLEHPAIQSMLQTNQTTNESINFDFTAYNWFPAENQIINDKESSLKVEKDILNDCSM